MDHADLRRAILDVSLKLGTELGEDGLTMRAIARNLGVSATALYQHYEGKGAILRELRSRGVEQLNKFLAPAFDLPNPAHRLRQNAVLYLRFSRVHPWMYDLLTESPEDWGENTEEKKLSALESLRRIRIAVEDCEAQGLLLEGVDSSAAPLAMWAALHGMALLMNTGRVSPDHSHFPTDDADVVTELFADYVVRSFIRSS
ncbi:MAG: TetR/AcrR family transcriptional regulator [Myxococcota bacterium]